MQLLHLVEPRNQRMVTPESRINQNHNPKETSKSHTPIWTNTEGGAHNAQSHSPPVQNLWGPAKHSHRQGEGTQHTQTPCQSGSQVTPPNAGPWNPISFTHTGTGRPVATFGTLVDDASALGLPHSTLHSTQVAISHCDGKWQHPPRPVLRPVLSEDSKSVHHWGHLESSSPITLGRHRSPHVVTRAPSQGPHHVMTWPPHPASGSPAAPCCGHFPPSYCHCARSAARTRAVPGEQARAHAAGSHARVRDRVPDRCAPGPSIVAPTFGGGGGGEMCPHPRVPPPIAARLSGGGAAGAQQSPAPKPNVAHPERGAPGTAHEGRGESRELNEVTI